MDKLQEIKSKWNKTKEELESIYRENEGKEEIYHTFRIMFMDEVEDVQWLIQTVEHHQKRIEQLEKALEFYANPKTYRLGVKITMGSAHPQHEPIKYDKGERARKALEDIEG